MRREVACIAWFDDECAAKIAMVCVCRTVLAHPVASRFSEGVEQKYAAVMRYRYIRSSAA